MGPHSNNLQIRMANIVTVANTTHAYDMLHVKPISPIHLKPYQC